MPQRYDLDAGLDDGRQAIDAKWSPKKRTLVAGACIGVAALAIAGGVYAMMALRPPKLPTTTQEALAVMASPAFDRLDEQRKREYAAEAGRLLRDMDAEQRQAIFRDQDNREAMQVMRMEMFDEMARKYARGEEVSFPWQRPRGQSGERPQRPEGSRPEWRRPDPENMTEEQKKEMEAQRAERRKQMMSRIAGQFDGGNAQRTGLRSEMFKRMRQSGARPGGGRGGGGGRRRGGG